MNAKINYEVRLKTKLGLLSYPSVQVINVLWKKVTTSKFTNKSILNKQIEDFDRRIKLKTYFKNKVGKDYKTEEDLFEKRKNKSFAPIK